jgi:hypothetical protein
MDDKIIERMAVVTFAAIIVVWLSGCTVHFGIDYTGKTDKSNVSESPNFRREK